MNILKAKIIQIQTEDKISIIKSSIEEHTLSAMLLDLPQNIKIGDNIELIFKEHEVMLATSESVVSARNAFVGEITEIEIGKILCSVGILFGENVITSIITKEAHDSLMLEVKKEILWCVKANEVSVRI